MVFGMLGLLMPACTLDRYPTTQILLSDAFQTFEDVERHRNGIYNELRRVRFGVVTTTTELMGDLFNASTGFGNRGGQPHRLQVEFMNSFEVRDIWINLYGAIAQVNFFLDNIGNIEPANEEQYGRIVRFRAEAHYARAYLYSVLAQHFMYPLRNENGATMTWHGWSIDQPELGLPLVSTFDFDARPFRSTIRETFDFILRDIDSAKVTVTISDIFGADIVEGLPEHRNSPDPDVQAEGPEGPRRAAGRITRDAVYALEARVRFMKRDFSGAFDLATQLINSTNADGTPRYPLTNTEAGLRTMWRNDNSEEDIFLLHVSTTSFGTASVQGGFVEQNMAIFSTMNTATGRFNPDWLPTQSVLDLYTLGDHRLNVFFSNPETQIVEYLFPHHGVRFMYKWPGNAGVGPAIARRHRPRMHSIAEMYLIRAEISENPAHLTALRTARGAVTPITSENFAEELRNEWVREKIGEGFRIESLRRWGPVEGVAHWGLGTNRRVPQDPSAVAMFGSELFTDRQMFDYQFYRLTLPIPAQDMRTNPNIRQTPSWVNPQ